MVLKVRKQRGQLGGTRAGQGGPGQARSRAGRSRARRGGSGGARGSQGGPGGPGGARWAPGWRGGGFRVFTLTGTSTGPGTGPSRGCYRPYGCGEAGKRIGSLCAVEVEGLKRRPPTEVGGLSLEFRVQGVGCRETLHPKP